MKDIHYIFCDLDGTLLHEDKTPSHKTIAYLRQLKQEQNITVGIATGRALTSVLPLIKTHEFQDVIDVIVANNGVDILQSGKCQSNGEGMVTSKQIEAILKAYASYPFLSVSFHQPPDIYATRNFPRVYSMQLMNHFDQIRNPLEDKNDPSAPRVMLLFDPKDKALVEKVVQAHPFEGLKGYFAEPDIYEFSNAAISKHKAIAHYVEQQGDTLDNVMVFGDSGNDIGMLQACGIGVVMYNATEDIKAIGDYITDKSNEEDGIYDFLKHHQEVFSPKQ